LLGVGYGNLLDDQGVELTLFFVQIVVQNRNLDTWQMPIFLTKSISEERSLLSRIQIIVSVFIAYSFRSFPF
jgi:hypothetical protein